MKKNFNRREMLYKVGRYASLVALGTYLILNPKSAQATSIPDPPSDGGEI